eukprot:974825-Pyramimonas_sp.AAC.1
MGREKTGTMPSNTCYPKPTEAAVGHASIDNESCSKRTRGAVGRCTHSFRTHVDRPEFSWSLTRRPLGSGARSAGGTPQSPALWVTQVGGEADSESFSECTRTAVGHCTYTGTGRSGIPIDTTTNIVS